MNINNFYRGRPSFSAEFVNNINMYKRNETGEYDPVELAVVKLDINDKNDMNTLRYVADAWGKEYKIYNYGEHYSNVIYGSAKIERKYNKKHLYTDTEFYMATTQKYDFEKLDYKQVVAEAQVINTTDLNTIAVEYLQVRPKYKYSGIKDREIKDIGKMFLTDISRNIIKKRADICSDHTSCGFYRAIGAEEDEIYEHSFIF